MPHRKDVAMILLAALKASPAQTAYFLTDIQSADGIKGAFESDMTFRDFWRRHNTCGLRFNTLYSVKA